MCSASARAVDVDARPGRSSAAWPADDLDAHASRRTRPSWCRRGRCSCSRGSRGSRASGAPPRRCRACGGLADELGGRSSVLVGMQAQNGHSPPTSSCSTIAVDRPALTSRLAAPRPPGPAPKTTASNCFFLVIVGAYLPVRDGWESSCRACSARPRIDHRIACRRRRTRASAFPSSPSARPCCCCAPSPCCCAPTAATDRAATASSRHRPRPRPSAPARGSCLVPARAAERFQSTTRRRVVALTFDDGPGPATASILTQLRRARQHATFFVIGRQIAAHAGDLARRRPRRQRDRQPHLGPRRRERRRRAPPRASCCGPRARSAARRARRRACCARPTGAPARASSRPRGRRAWSSPSGTSTRRTGARRARRAPRAPCSSALRPGAIILLHDGGPRARETRAALPRILRGLERRGYRSVTVPALLHLRRAPLDGDLPDPPSRGIR